jgi:hypothetical protein
VDDYAEGAHNRFLYVLEYQHTCSRGVLVEVAVSSADSQIQAKPLLVIDLLLKGSSFFPTGLRVEELQLRDL